MRIFKNFFIVVSLIFGAFCTKTIAQNCLPPQEFQIQIQPSIPPVAHISWSAPTGGQPIGYLLQYRIDQQPVVFVNLPAQPVFYEVTLPESWTLFEAEIASICENGEVSEIEKTKKANLIIIDLVLARTTVTPENIVCSGICPNATHFRADGATNKSENANGSISDEQEGSRVDPPDVGELGLIGTNQLILFNIDRFCTCMQANGNDYSQATIDFCKFKSRDLFDPANYNLVVCSNTLRNEQQTYAGISKQATIYPNPFDRTLLLHLPSVSGGVFRLLTLQGQLIFEQQLTEGSSGPISIQAPELIPGGYFYTAQSNDGALFSGKLMHN